MEKYTRYSKMVKMLALISMLSIIFTGCNNSKVAGVSTEAPTQPPPPTATSTAVPPTSTVTPVPPTDTPVPTATKVPTATPDLKATLAAQATSTQEAINQMVAADLVKYGVDPKAGHVAWVMEDPAILDGSGYAQGFFNQIEDLGVVTDFVIQSEITWKTSGGLSGCGYIFRGPEDWDVSTSDFYILILLRLQGSPRWMIDYFKKGLWQYSFPNAAGVRSTHINDQNENKNLVTLIAQGSTYTVYINGEKEQVAENNRIGEGRIAFTVYQNSGTSFCQFENGWVWVYDK